MTPLAYTSLVTLGLFGLLGLSYIVAEALGHTVPSWPPEP